MLSLCRSVFQAPFVSRAIRCRTLAHGPTDDTNPPPRLTHSQLRSKMRAESAANNQHLAPGQTAFQSKGPYPEREVMLQGDRKREIQRLTVYSEKDDRDSSVILFPGQGSQFVGMGSKLEDVPTVKEMFDRASHILEYDLWKLCTEGPKETLDMTICCQPAVVVTSLAAVEKLYSEKPEAVEKCIATAGFSVGEITALIFSGALAFDDGIRLVKARAEAMQYCSEMTNSGMMTIFYGADNKVGLGLAAAKEWVQQTYGISQPVCNIATYLYSGAKVISGHEETLQFLEENKSDFGIRRTKRLAVSGAFHTSLMKPAVEVLKHTLDSLPLNNPRIPVYSNVDSKVYNYEGQIRKTLPKQIVKCVKWEQSMNDLFRYTNSDFVPDIYECGPGNALSAMLTKINGKVGKKAKYVSVK